LFRSNQLQAGTPVLVEGRLNYRTWESQDGQKRSALDVNANRVEVLTFGPRGDDATVADARGQERLRNALNQVMIIGNLTRDAELRYKRKGSAGTRSSAAVNEPFGGRAGEDQGRPSYVEGPVWPAPAEATGKRKRGDRVFVVGRPQTDTWADKGGNRRFTTRGEGQRVE